MVLKGQLCTPSAAKVDIIFVTNKLLTKKKRLVQDATNLEGRIS